VVPGTSTTGTKHKLVKRRVDTVGEWWKEMAVTVIGWNLFEFFRRRVEDGDVDW